MADGSEMLPAGTYVRVDKRLPVDGYGSAFEQQRSIRESYIGVIVGTDVFGSKYHIGGRYMGWSEWHFLDGGSWAFIGEVTPISEAEALALPEVEA